MRINNRLHIILCMVMMMIMTGCATRPTDPEALRIYEQNNDPLEPMNRAVFRFNMTADEYVLEPVARGYRAVVPEPARDGIGNFLENIKQPVYLFNAILQGDGTACGQITTRFLANTFFGFFGVFDSATHMKIPVVKRDFGQTLAVWGVENGGPYLVIPFWGASNVRDATGMAVDAFAQPLDYVVRDQWITVARWGANGIVDRERALDLVDSVKKSSTDLYATMRSMSQQNRRKEINALVHNPAAENPAPADYEFDFPDDEE